MLKSVYGMTLKTYHTQNICPIHIEFVTIFGQNAGIHYSTAG